MNYFSWTFDKEDYSCFVQPTTMYRSAKVKLGGRNIFYIFTFILLIFLYRSFSACDCHVTSVKPRSPLTIDQLVQEPPPATNASQEIRRKCLIPVLRSRKQFYEYFRKEQYICKDIRWFGRRDGKKAVCMDTGFYLIPQNCHVLSFGINNEWSFDDKFGNAGCKVYSFDPTMGRQSHQRSQNIQFFKLGISNITGQRRVGMGEHFGYFEVDRYVNILERLELSNVTIDYLKMDVELSELDFFQDVFTNTPHLLKNIRQLAVELHHGYNGRGLNTTQDDVNSGDSVGAKSIYKIYWKYIHLLLCHGFKLFHARRNGRWTEAVWINI